MESAYEYIIYPFLFAGLFFQVFLLLTFFEREARARRDGIALTRFPTVTIVVPCYNEEQSIRESLDSLLALDYPNEKLTVAVVDDGSTDSTGSIVDEYSKYAHFKIIHKENGGKHTALNAGIEATESEYIACLDADSIASPEALKEVVSHFDNEKIGAVTASMSINKPANMLERMQQAEYLLGIVLRHIAATVNGLYVTPGPFTVYRRSVFEHLGLFAPAHNTEDMEIALRMQRGGYIIQNAPRARVYTNAPSTLGGLLKQRVRWTTGFIKNGYDYRDLFGNPRYGALGLFILPLGIVSIISGIGLFLITLARSGEWLLDFFTRAREVPLDYTLSLPSIDPFFAPINPILILSMVGLAIMLSLMVLGAWISNTRSKLGPDILWYVVLYSVIAPLWLIRSVGDILFRVNRSWR